MSLKRISLLLCREPVTTRYRARRQWPRPPIGASLLVLMVVIAAGCGSQSSGNAAVNSAFSEAVCATNGVAWSEDLVVIDKALVKGSVSKLEATTVAFVHDLRADGCLSTSSRKHRIGALANDIEATGVCPQCVDVLDRALAGG